MRNQPQAPEPGVNILLVDDKPANLLALETILEGVGQNLIAKTSGEEALKYLLKEDVAVILLDVRMPGMDGLETAALVRQRSKSIPIIFITAASQSQEDIAAAYALGAVDYIFKPIVPEILLAKVSVFIELHQKNQVLKQQKEEKAQEAEQLRKQLAAQPVLAAWQDNAVTAQIAGVGPLRERSPQAFSALQTTYEDLLEAYLEAIGYGEAPPRHAINDLADHIGKLGGGPRDVVDVHLRSVQAKCQGVHPKRALAYTVEGRLLALELMGYLVDYYRGHGAAHSHPMPGSQVMGQVRL